MASSQIPELARRFLYPTRTLAKFMTPQQLPVSGTYASLCHVQQLQAP